MRTEPAPARVNMRVLPKLSAALQTDGAGTMVSLSGPLVGHPGVAAARTF